jgi:type VII secretion system ESX-1 substrate
MITYSFPAATFTVEGSPEAVREAGRAYGRFAATAGQASADLHGLDSGAWIGSEGDLFRARVAELPPHLDTAHGSFSQVARALDGFADALQAAQGRMAGVRADAEQTFAQLRAAQADQDQPRVERLRDTFDGQLTTAAGLRDGVVAAAQQAAHTIRAAGRTSPTAGQSWLAGGWEGLQRWGSDRLADLKGFIADHAEVFRFVADALRWVGGVLVGVGVLVAASSFVAGFFSFGTGWLGEIPAGTLIATGMVLWGIGDALDTTVDWAEGKISGTELLLSAGTSVALAFGGAVVVKLGAKIFKKLAPELYERLAKWVDKVLGRVPDPALPGPLGRDFKPGLFNPTGRQLTKEEQAGADLLVAEGKHVQALPEDHTVPRRKSVDFLVREDPEDPGVISELKSLRSPSSSAVQRNILDAGGQLDQYRDRYGPGRAVIDGRAVGLTADDADRGFRRAAGQARDHGQPMPPSIRIILGDGSSRYYP